MNPLPAGGLINTEQSSEGRTGVAKVIGGMTISLDGFIADESGDLRPLYPDLEELRDSEYMEELVAVTGSAVMGRHTYELGSGDHWDDYEFQVPIFVLTRNPPDTHPRGNENLSFTFVTELEPAIEQAKAAAGEKDVTVVGGASVNQQLLRAGLMDELRVDVMPLLLGSGLRLFDHLEGVSPQLEKTGIREAGQRTSLIYSVAG
jgi:dihydrofolate reductase